MTAEALAMAVAGQAADAEEGRVAALFEAHHLRLYKLARRMSDSSDSARDLVQETFLRVARSVASVPVGETAEEAWLVRVLINICRDELVEQLKLVEQQNRSAQEALKTFQATRGARGLTAGKTSLLAPMPRGFSVVLVVGDLQATGTVPDNLPEGAKKALADMKDFCRIEAMPSAMWLGSRAVAIWLVVFGDQTSSRML